MTFTQVLAVGERLATLGLKPAVAAKDVICYVEEWSVEAPEDFDSLDAWSTEDVTLVHVRDGWRGDFFLLAGAYHTTYLHYQNVGTYCSISHPWRIRERIIVCDDPIVTMVRSVRCNVFLNAGTLWTVGQGPAPASERGH